MNKCEKCGYMHFKTDGCRKPKESAEARKERDTKSEGVRAKLTNPLAGTTPAAAKPPADTIQKPKHKDRHKPGYMAAYLRKWRRGEVGNKYKKELDK